MMAWQMHHPFCMNAGPIKMISNQNALLIFNDVAAAQKALPILQQATFKNIRIGAEIIN